MNNKDLGNTIKNSRTLWWSPLDVLNMYVCVCVCVYVCLYLYECISLMVCVCQNYFFSQKSLSSLIPTLSIVSLSTIPYKWSVTKMQYSKQLRDSLQVQGAYYLWCEEFLEAIICGIHISENWKWSPWHQTVVLSITYPEPQWLWPDFLYFHKYLHNGELNYRFHSYWE